MTGLSALSVGQAGLNIEHVHIDQSDFIIYIVRIIMCKTTAQQHISQPA